MNRKSDVAIAALAICAVAIPSPLVQSVAGQSFANLNFEQATVAPAPAGYTPFDAYNPISAASALPHWTVTEDSTVCTAVWGSPAALDETSVALVSAGSNPIQGSYSVQLSAYADASSPYFRSSSISQTGLIPDGTESIQFLIADPYPASGIPPNPIVTINGTPMSLSDISQSDGIITIGGDVSGFAGDTVTLAFLCEATTGGTFPANENYFNLDDVQFSPSPVPEPSALGLTALSGLLLAWRRWKAQAVQPRVLASWGGSGATLFGTGLRLVWRSSICLAMPGSRMGIFCGIARGWVAS